MSIYEITCVKCYFCRSGVCRMLKRGEEAAGGDGECRPVSRFASVVLLLKAACRFSFAAVSKYSP